MEGDIDLRGFFAVDDTVRAGYQAIRGTVGIESSASEAELHQLREAVNGHRPVQDILRAPVPVELTMEASRPAHVAE